MVLNTYQELILHNCLEVVELNPELVMALKALVLVLVLEKSLAVERVLKLLKKFMEMDWMI